MSIFEKRFNLFIGAKTVNELRDIEKMLEVFYMINGSYEVQLKLVRKRIREIE